MTKYMLILRSDVTQDYSKFTPEDFQELLGAYQAWGEKMAGRLGVSRKLMDEGGRVIHQKEGQKLEVKDGPYVETKEVVGGIYILEADSYDHATKLCENHPNFRFGTIEIREVDFMGGPEE